MESINSIDINADLGEFRNEKQFTNELNMLNYISSCSVACGGHIGDSNSIKLIIEACKEHNIAIGPHPSYPDKEGFGRRVINIDANDLEKSIRKQIHLFLTVAESSSLAASHVKLHGQLYNETSKEEKLANLFLNIVNSFDNNLSVIGPANSLLEHMAKEADISFVAEAFIDRCYREDYSLVDRNQEGALLESIEDQINQAKSIAVDQRVLTDNKKHIQIKAETLCIHGDNPDSLMVVQGVSKMLKAENFNIQSYSS